MNNLVIVGRLVSGTELKTSENNEKMCSFRLAVPRPFKNMDGIYETDFISCVAFNLSAMKLHDYLKKGDLIGVKGRLQCQDVDGKMVVIVEKLSFLSGEKVSD